MKIYPQTTEVTGGLSIIPAIEDASFRLVVNISPGSAATVEKLVVKPADRSHPSATMLLQRKDLCNMCNLTGVWASRSLAQQSREGFNPSCFSVVGLDEQNPIREGFTSSQVPPVSSRVGCCRQTLWGLGKVPTTLSHSPGCGSTVILGPFQCLPRPWAGLPWRSTGHVFL